MVNRDLMGDQYIGLNPGDFRSGGRGLGRPRHRGKEVLLHELQHIVQGKEGFAKGGNPDIFLPGSVYAESLLAQGGRKGQDLTSSQYGRRQQNYKRLAGEVEARNVTRRFGTAPSRKNQIPTETEDIGPLMQILRMVHD